MADKRPNFMRRLKPIYRYLPLGAIIIAQTAFAADADNGKRLALLRCSSCHVVMRNQRNEVVPLLLHETCADLGENGI